MPFLSSSNARSLTPWASFLVSSLRLKPNALCLPFSSCLVFALRLMPYACLYHMMPLYHPPSIWTAAPVM